MYCLKRIIDLHHILSHKDTCHTFYVKSILILFIFSIYLFIFVTEMFETFIFMPQANQQNPSLSFDFRHRIVRRII